MINDRHNLYYNRALTLMVDNNAASFKNNHNIHCHFVGNLESIPERLIGDVGQTTLNSAIRDGWLTYNGIGNLLR